MQNIKLKAILSDKDAEKLKGKFLTGKEYHTLVQSDTDGYDEYGNLLFKFRKGVVPFELLKQGYMAFRESIEATESRGAASGSSGKRIRADGSTSKITVGNFVESGAVGFLDPAAMIPYCRKTAFTAKYFDRFNSGVPFVECVDRLYEQLCPEHYMRQINIANGTNRNYRISDTAFTTVTVNKNFQTAVHKDSGDYKPGFGNLIVYREGKYEGCYFCLPKYGVAIDLQNTDILFVNVHEWHANTPFINCSPDFLRISFVMYYREYMIQCSQPAQELQKIKMQKGGFNKL